ncbi:MAG: hypothetical protein LBK67_11690 [Coriobacteriales bacterium]|jgi:hypothetical protein|nr:hypothetical protein [Coriobacteriales bacterium]
MSIADDGQVLGYRAVGIFAAAEYLMINDGREILPALYGEEIASSLDDGYLRFQIIDPAGDVVMQTADWRTLVKKMEEIKDLANRYKDTIAHTTMTEELNGLFNLKPLDASMRPGHFDTVAVHSHTEPVFSEMEEPGDADDGSAYWIAIGKFDGALSQLSDEYFGIMAFRDPDPYPDLDDLPETGWTAVIDIFAAGGGRSGVSWPKDAAKSASECLSLFKYGLLDLEDTRTRSCILVPVDRQTYESAFFDDRGGLSELIGSDYRAFQDVIDKRIEDEGAIIYKLEGTRLGRTRGLKERGEAATLLVRSGPFARNQGQIKDNREEGR